MTTGLFLAVAALHAQTGPRVLTVVSTVDGSQQPYALYLPGSFDPRKEYGLLVSLHSEDSNHRLNLAQVLGVVGRGSDPEARPWRRRAGFPALRDRDLIVACPWRAEAWAIRAFRSRMSTMCWPTWSGAFRWTRTAFI